MEDDLVMNRLPLPKYYDGSEWNTVIKPTRKSIPKYLHEDLPQLKHIYIKEKFKEIGKFNCPKLDYFNGMIKNKKSTQRKSFYKGENSKSSTKNRKVASYLEIKQQLQYALIMADKDSNIVDQLLQKAKNSVEDKNNFKHGHTQIRHKKKRLSLSRQNGKYFGNTVQLVFKNRKKQYLNSLRQEPEIDTTEVQEKINNIKLIDFQN